MWTTKYDPMFLQPALGGGDYKTFGLMSVPVYSFYSNITMDEVYMINLIIQMNDPDDHSTIDSLANALEAKSYGVDITKTYESEDTTSMIQGILNKVFYGLITVTMFLCFFSLCASMSANLYEQKKEVGVLRAMGFTKYRVRILYFYEALILVIVSCILGVLIGTIVGFTMLL